MNAKKRTYRLLILCGCLLLLGGIWLLTERSSLQEAAEEPETESYMLVGLTETEITEIGMNTNEESYNLKKEGEGWSVLEDSSMKPDTELIETFLSEVTALDSEFKIDDVTDFDQYGLDSPYLNLTLQTENDMCVIKVGNYNSMISAYYVQINDEATVYTITSTDYYRLNKNLEDFESTEETTEETTEG